MQYGILELTDRNNSWSTYFAMHSRGTKRSSRGKMRYKLAFNTIHMRLQIVQQEKENMTWRSNHEAKTVNRKANVM